MTPLNRRQLLRQAGCATALLSCPAWNGQAEDPRAGVEVNDIQSQLNSTWVDRIVTPRSIDDIESALRDAQRMERSVCVAGGRHAMGGQQFGTNAVLFDMRSFKRVLNFDGQKGLITVEAGIEWPELIDYLHREQADDASTPWGIHQKQSGVDRVSIGGSLAANIHGRCLQSRPIISDVESFELIDAQGKVHRCSRTENRELFSLAIGGYGLFGIITQVTLRLAPRTKLRRSVELVAIKDLLPAIDRMIAQGHTYGDCQYATDLTGPADAHMGILSCYQPVAAETAIAAQQKQLSATDWAELYQLARTNKKQAYERYSHFYLQTAGQVYWSDIDQLAGNFDGYRTAVDPNRGTEVITEVYVPRDRFLELMGKNRQDFIDFDVDMTYGTIRFIEQDSESFLAWAREASVCIVCNLHVVHTETGKQKAADDFRRIIDRAIEHGGRYYLTYHRWANRKQVEACYPNFVDFLRLKRKYDPQERFQSDWYRHYRALFADRL